MRAGALVGDGVAEDELEGHDVVDHTVVVLDHDALEDHDGRRSVDSGGFARDGVVDGGMCRRCDRRLSRESCSRERVARESRVVRERAVARETRVARERVAMVNSRAKSNNAAKSRPTQNCSRFVPSWFPRPTIILLHHARHRTIHFVRGVSSTYFNLQRLRNSQDQ